MDIDIFKTKLKRVLAFFRPEVQAETRIKLDIAEGKAALLVIDVQREFADPAGDRGNRETHRVAKRLSSLIPAFRAAGLPAYAVYYSEEGKKKPQDIDFYLFRPAENDTLIAKDQDSAFRGSDIKKILQADKRKTLITCGFNLNACVFRTVMDARDNGFEVVLLEDLTGNDNDNDRGKTAGRVAEMKQKGVRFVNALDLLEEVSDFKKDHPLPGRFVRPFRPHK